MNQAEVAFTLLESVFAKTKVAFDRTAQPIAFEMLTGGGIWSFEPGRGRQLFVKRDVMDAPLRIRTIPEVLIRLVLQPGFQLTAELPFFCEGDLAHLEPLIDSLSGKQNALALRSTKKRSKKGRRRG